MRQLIAALANLAVLVEQAIHGANRAVILAFIEQRRINSGCGAILETFFVQTSQDRFSFCPIKGPRRRRPRGRRYGWGRSLTALPVEIGRASCRERGEAWRGGERIEGREVATTLQ